MFSLISDQTFIFQRLQWNLHQAELTQGKLDSRADLTSGRVDPLLSSADNQNAYILDLDLSWIQIQ